MDRIGRIDTPQDALLFCDYLAKFAPDETIAKHYAGLSRIIRDLMGRLERQAMQAEKSEARKGGAA